MREKQITLTDTPKSRTSSVPPSEAKVLVMAEIDIGRYKGVNFNGLVILPIVASGELWHEGWDIPTLWAIDGENSCWANDAHGHALERSEDINAFVGMFRNHADEHKVRQLLGLKPRLPSWVRAARSAGWTPPEGFNEADYEV